MNIDPMITMIAEMDDIMDDFEYRPMWMIRPQINRKYPNQRVMMTAEIVDIDLVNLAIMQNIEVI